MPTLHNWQHHSYDHLMRGKSPMAFRLNDIHHQNVNVGDVIHLHDRPEFIQQQKFKVIAKTEHPTIAQAVNNIQHSQLSARDKIQLVNDFHSFHGPSAHSHPVVSFHLEPHAGSTSVHSQSPSFPRGGK